MSEEITRENWMAAATTATMHINKAITYTKRLKEIRNN